MSRPWRRIALRSAYWLAIITLMGVTTLCVVFSRFASYDDEGYMLMFAKKLLDGGQLYDEVFGQYGPVFALWKLLLHGVLRVPLSHTGVRLETAALVTGTLGLIALGTHRLTGSTWAAALALVVCQKHLVSMARNEPGHPQFLGLFLLVVALWLAGAAARSAQPRWLSVAAGALVALLALVKVNAGLYLAVALLTWLALPWAQARLTRAGLVCAAGIALQLVLFRGDARLWNAWGWKYWLVSSLCLTGVVTVASVSPVRWPSALPWRWTLVGAAGAGALPILWTLVRGTSLAGLVDGLLLQPLRLGSRFFVPVDLTPEDLALAVFGAVLATVWAAGVRLNAFGGVVESAVVGVAQLGFGALIVWLALAAPSTSVFAAGPAGLWLIAARSDRRAGSHGAPEIRALVASVVAWQFLYAYPVAGSQMGYVAVLVAACGVVCVRDGLVWLGVAADRHLPATPFAEKALVAVALAAVLVVQWADAAGSLSRYGRLSPLGLMGTRGVRLSPDRAAPLRDVTALIQRSGCTSLISFPGMFSFNFWTGVDSPTTVNVTAWMILSASEQRRLVRDVEQAGSSCVLTNARVERELLRGDVAADPVARWLATRRFEELGRIGNYELRTTGRKLRLTAEPIAERD